MPVMVRRAAAPMVLPGLSETTILWCLTAAALNIWRFHLVPLSQNGSNIIPRQDTSLETIVVINISQLFPVALGGAWSIYLTLFSQFLLCLRIVEESWKTEFVAILRIPAPLHVIGETWTSYFFRFLRDACLVLHILGEACKVDCVAICEVPVIHIS